MFLFVLRPSQYLEGWFDNLQDNPLLRHAAKLNNDVKALPGMSIFANQAFKLPDATLVPLLNQTLSEGSKYLFHI